MKTTVYNQSADKIGELELNPKIFSVEKTKPAVVHQVVVSMLSSARNVVASTKTRGEVRGGGKKPWQQKGTGRARAGSSRSPLWRGGGVTFGPRSNRNFEKKVNKKMKTLSLFSLLSDKAIAGKLVVLENLELEKGKTKELATLIKNISAKIPELGRKQLLVISDKQKAVALAGRNLPATQVVLGSHLNVLDLISADSVIVMADALPVIEKTYLKK